MIIEEQMEKDVVLRITDDEQSNPLVDQLTHLCFPEVAQTLRMAIESITLDWVKTCRVAMPQMQHLTFDELKDSTPEILYGIADALASDDPGCIRELIDRAPAQGLSRFKLGLDVIEVMQEDRLLRAIAVHHVELGLNRQMGAAESAALHAAIDVMLQRSVIALVSEQKSALRSAAATELKFLSFLAHDLNNNLNNVTLSLSVLAMDLAKTGQFANAMQSLERAQKGIDDTVHGMRQMLQHERMRQTAKTHVCMPVDLHQLAQTVVSQFAQAAIEKNVEFAVEVRSGTEVESDRELITLVLQNFVGNALKYSRRGTVRIGCDFAEGRPALWVSDEGPGIAKEKMRDIFAAFKRGELHGQTGVGLGLAIASEAAKLLNAELTVESILHVGSTFRLSLPATLQKC
jgi:signal transduction histidine kinase